MPNYENPALWLETDKVESGSVCWKSPSNLAIIKYWGKHGLQLPQNPSISATLSNAFTKTTLHYGPVEAKVKQQTIDLEFKFEGKPNEKFQERLIRFFRQLLPVFPFLKQLSFKVESENSFPHSSGIASSASAMSALALCLCSLEDKLFGTLSDDLEFDRKASYVARLGSGSACRSVYGYWSVWGQTGELPSSSEEYAIGLKDEIHESFLDMRDSILIISEEKKSVSSSQGHALMEDHSYADARFKQARQRFHQILPALRSGNWDSFGAIAENEALTLHGLMMTSNPSYMLMHPDTLAVLREVRSFRSNENIPVYFSLDAGPNVHLLYPAKVEEKVNNWINDVLKYYCHNERVIFDHVGEGPEEI